MKLSKIVILLFLFSASSTKASEKLRIRNESNQQNQYQVRYKDKDYNSVVINKLVPAGKTLEVEFTPMNEELKFKVETGGKSCGMETIPSESIVVTSSKGECNIWGLKHWQETMIKKLWQEVKLPVLALKESIRKDMGSNFDDLNADTKILILENIIAIQAKQIK